MRKWETLKFAALLAVAIGAGPVSAAVWQWSTTAGSNATADPTVNWAAGMAPSAVSPSGRAMMAAIAEWRDDTSGLLVDTGSATAYLVASESGYAATPTNGQQICFTPANTNAAGITLSVDSGNTYPLQSPPGTAISIATMIAGNPYCVVFNSGSGGAWILKNNFSSSFAQFVVPIGGMIVFTGTTSPNSNFIFPCGQAISRTTYATYFGMVGTTYGVGDGITTFNVPNLCGSTVIGLDGMGGNTPTNLVTVFNAAALGTKGGAQNESIAQANLPNVSFAVNIPAGQGSHTHDTNLEAVLSGSPLGTGARSTQHVENEVFTAAATLPAMSGTAASGGIGTALTTVQPSIALPFLLRII
jgi:microcystin-dependent protein